MITFNLRKFSLVLLALGLNFFSSAQTSDWLPLDKGVGCDDFGNRVVYNLYADTLYNVLYAGGNFGHDGYCSEMRTIAKWNGEDWEAMGSSASIGGRAIVRFDNHLIASGPFILDTMVNNFTNVAAEWTENTWDTIPGGPNSSMRDLIVNDGKLYSVGDFTECGYYNSGVTCVYDGESWEPLEVIEDFGAFTSAQTFYQGNYYAGGLMSFENGLGEEIVDLCYFDGSHFRQVGQGVQNWVYSAVSGLAVLNDTLYIGGQIRLPGDDETHWMVTFDGDSLRPMTQKPNDEVAHLMVHNGALYAAGGFTEVGNVEAEHLARYDGEEWIAINTDSLFSTAFYMGYQYSTAIRDITVMNDTLYMGGAFYRINQDTVRYVAKLNKNLTTDFPPPATTTEEHELETFDFDLYPNPSPGSLTFSWQQPAAGEVSYRITDARGRLVEHSPPVIYQSGKHEETLTLGHLTTGTYFIRLITPSGVATKRWVRLK